jgi:hypothetical protein
MKSNLSNFNRRLINEVRYLANVRQVGRALFFLFELQRI